MIDLQYLLSVACACATDLTDLPLFVTSSDAVFKTHYVQTHFYQSLFSTAWAFSRIILISKKVLMVSKGMVETLFKYGFKQWLTPVSHCLACCISIVV